MTRRARTTKEAERRFAAMDRGALDGLRVVELATMVAGPYCGKLLADMGAEVIKVEPPEGDPSRLCGPFPPEGPHPEKSALFLYNNTNKKSLALDLGSPRGLARVRELLRWADVCIDDHPPGTLETLGLEWSGLQGVNPGLVVTCITPYGRTGPRADRKADELTLIQAGGLGNLLPARSVDGSRAPVKMGGYPVGYHGGLVAAFATLCVLLGRRKTGRGDLIDISLQEVVLHLVRPAVPGSRYHDTTWSRIPDRPPALGRMQTSDGYVVVNALDDHQFRALRELMGKPEWIAGDEWDSLAYRTHHLNEITWLLDKWMLGQQKDDVHHRAAKRGIPIGPINSAHDVMRNPQYLARGYFVDVDHPEAGSHRYAGWPYRFSATPPRVRQPAPLLDAHNEQASGEALRFPSAGPMSSRGGGQDSGAAPLQGIRVLDFSWVWAGPFAGMLLAAFGAEVIKVEGHKRMDFMRRQVAWPLPERAPLKIPVDGAIAFHAVNLSKKSVTIDLARPEGVDLVRRLVAISDVVVDNLRPGAMEKLGLGYEDLCRIRPDIIAASSSGRGRYGPESSYRGFALVHHAIGGGAFVTGYPDDHPSHSTGDVDLMNATTLAYAIAAALHHRQQTGQGQFIDYSQCEGVTSLIGDMLLGYAMNGQVPQRMGNAHPRFAPHNVYRCWGVDRWMALEVHADEEFAALTRVMGMQALARDPRFTTMQSRKCHERELDGIIEAWTRERDRDWMVEALCRQGLAAAPSRDARDLYADPHLRARGVFLTVDHPQMGPLELVGMPWKMRHNPVPLSRGPFLGEHNRYVLQELLGLCDKELAALQEKGIVTKP